ncbi:MAG: 2-amino-4-hydroxy-6-hydroxymethyldihydropteridine diphosphokinase [Streptosporangiales bacterium]|nr:2-amino-4-hydroxy-6-hydroxymethyldihydropteridine diphosphokinase [Streptosporangiales bacterium]
MKPKRTRRAVLALGSNLGERMENLQGALDALLEAPGLRLLGVSPVYETTPVGGPEQPNYLNAVLVVETSLTADTLLERARGVEDAFARTREIRWGARTLDVDLVAIGEQTSADPELTLPHPRAHERAFVLVPWRDVDPDAVLPGHGRIVDLIEKVGSEGVQRRDDLVLQMPA